MQKYTKSSRTQNVTKKPCLHWTQSWLKITMQCKAYSKQLLILNTVVLFVINVCQADRLPHTLYGTWNCFDHPRSWHRGPVEQQQKCCNRICWNRYLYRDLEFVLTTLHINANFITHTHTHKHIHTPVYRPFFLDYPGEPVPERWNQSGFYWSKRQWVAVASAGLYASLHLALFR